MNEFFNKPNSNIINKKVDKQFATGLTHAILAFIVNIILGSYIIYVSKILQVIQLPTDILIHPYNQGTSPVPLQTVNPNNFIGINYLYTSTANDSANDSALNAVAAGANIVASTSFPVPLPPTTVNPSNPPDPNKSPELYFTKINIDPNDINKVIGKWGFFDDLYTSKDWVIVIILKLIMQEIYIFYYWGLCIFFNWANGYTKLSSGNEYTIYLWETFIMLFGFILFLLFSIGLTVLLTMYISYYIISKIMYLWNYNTDENGLLKYTKEIAAKKSGGRLFVEGVIALYMMCTLFGAGIFIFMSSLSFVAVPFLMPYFIYLFATLTQIPCSLVSTAAQINAVKAEGSEEGPSYGKNMFALVGVLIGLQSLGIAHLYGFGAYGSITMAVVYIIGYIGSAVFTKNSQGYSTTSILLSKLVPITFCIAFIIILFSGYYGFTIMISVFLIFLSIWFTYNKHKLLFYPYDPAGNENFVKYNDNDYIQTYPSPSCSKKPVKGEDSYITQIINILLEENKPALAAATAAATAATAAATAAAAKAPATAAAAKAPATAKSPIGINGLPITQHSYQRTIDIMKDNNKKKSS